MGELTDLYFYLIEQWGTYKESINLENKHRWDEADQRDQERRKEFEEWREVQNIKGREAMRRYQQELEEYNALPSRQKRSTAEPVKERLRDSPPYYLLYPTNCPCVTPTWIGFLDWCSVQHQKYAIEDGEERDETHTT